MNFATGQNELQDVSTPDEWSRPPAFPSGAGGLVSTADDFLKFGRMLLNRGTFGGKRLLSDASVAAMTSNQLTDEQIATAGPILAGQGWGYGQAVAVKPSTEWPVPDRYGWAGGYGTYWLNDPHRGIIAMVLTQVSAFMWTGGLDEFVRLVGSI
jgi:CubicO group peptidase (beta-lactamase class C family)